MTWLFHAITRKPTGFLLATVNASGLRLSPAYWKIVAWEQSFGLHLVGPLRKGAWGGCQHASFINLPFINSLPSLTLTFLGAAFLARFLCFLLCPHSVENLSPFFRRVSGSLSLLPDGQLKLLAASSSSGEMIRWSLRKHNHKLKLWMVFPPLSRLSLNSASRFLGLEPVPPCMDEHFLNA